MKSFTLFLLGMSFLVGSLHAADPARKNCNCQDCRCTADSHCGCMSGEGCHCKPDTPCGVNKDYCSEETTPNTPRCCCQ